ncbi:MAG: hypothetical protein AAGI28_04300 [Pseudomonadota bacterium]
MIIEFASMALIAAAASGPAAVQLEDRQIRLSDLAIVEGGTEDAVIARMPRGTSKLQLDADSAQRLIRNRLPLTSVELNFEDNLILVAPTETSSRQAGDCFAASSPIAKGDFIFASAVEHASCEGASKPDIVGYDREARAFVAKDSVVSGTYLGPIRPASRRHIAKGEDVLLVTGAGPVTITRSVITVQTARENRNVFIRTNDGNVFPVPVSHILEDQAQ